MKKFLRVLLIVFGILVVLFTILHFFARYKIGDFLDHKIQQGDFTYQDFSINVLAGNVAVNQINYRWKENEISAEEIKINDVSYFKYLFHHSIQVNNIKIKKPHVFLSSQTKKDTNSTSSRKQTLKSTIKINKIEITKGNFSFKKDSIEQLTVENYSIKLHKIQVDSTSLSQKIPFRYQDYQVEINHLAYEVSKLQRLKIDSLSIHTKNVWASNLRLEPKFSRSEYIHQIPYEKDLMKLSLDTFQIKNYTLSLNKTDPEFRAPELLLRSMNFSIYRDKTIVDDTRKKPLYSKMLRKLKLKLAIDTVKIQNAKLTYEERIKANRPPGKLVFENLNANISQITNINLNRADFPPTKVDINTDFMKEAPLDFHWQFKVNDTLDRFSFNGNVSSVSPESINSFFTPAFNMKAKGAIDAVYFNYAGNNNLANGDIKLHYDNFKVEVLQKDGKEKNTLLSVVANILVKKSPKNGSISKHITDVKRDKTKSFWNYFWSCLEKGLRKSLI